MVTLQINSYDINISFNFFNRNQIWGLNYSAIKWKKKVHNMNCITSKSAVVSCQGSWLGQTKYRPEVSCESICYSLVEFLKQF